ncbi:MAG TPA: hypothetical protein VFF81_03310 [Noviherbaspirillum sp.]|nr:hypothetical protein [Noviherbaspirillum sp.]
MPEWQLVDDGTPVRQGDLLVLRHPRSLLCQETVIVLTADCDIAQSKTSDGYAGLSVIPLTQYVRQHWASKHAKKVVSSDLIELVNTFNKVASESKPAQKPLSSSAIIQWVKREDSSKICSALNVVDNKLQKKLTRCVQKLFALSNLERSAGQDTCFDEICTYYSIKNESSSDVAKELITKKVRTELTSLPEDVFLLSSFPDKPNDPYVVLLRSLVAIPFDKVTTSAEQAREENLYLRYGRLAHAFKYAVSQQFALLYSRVGLPAAYDQQKKALAESFAC